MLFERVRERSVQSHLVELANTGCSKVGRWDRCFAHIVSEKSATRFERYQLCGVKK